MKKISIVAGVVTAAIAVISTASAVQVNSSAIGTMLSASGADQQYISRSSSGVSNTSASTKYVYGLVARNPHAAGNQTVTWTGYSNNVANNNCCSVWAQHEGGGTTSKQSCVTGVNGYYTTSVSFTTAEAPTNSSYTAYCTLLASGANRVLTFRVNP
ncbi:MAG TPA: hypothetical protein VIV60_04520 [Polyangiaceae bacterium]